MSINFFNILRNTGATVLTRGGSGIARIVLLLLIARKFGPEDFGRLSIILSLVEIMRVIADFGIDVVTIRRFSVNKRLSSRLLGNVLSLKMIHATLGYAVALGVYWAMYHSVQGLYLLLIVGMSLYSTLLINAFVSHFQANLKMSSIIVSSLASTSAYILFTFAGLYLSAPLEVLALIIPGSELINLVITASIHRKSWPVRLELNRRIALSLLKQSIPVAAGGIAVVLLLRMDNLMLGWFTGERNVGVYSAAYRFIEPFTLVFSSLSISVYASLAALGRNSASPEARRALLRVIGAVSAAAVLASCLLIVFSDTIIGMISADYRESVPILQLLSVVILFKAINAQLTAFLNANGRFGSTSLTSAVSLAVNTLLYLLMIPAYGIMGAAIAVIATESLNTLMQGGLVIHLLRAGSSAGKAAQQ